MFFFKCILILLFKDIDECLGASVQENICPADSTTCQNVTGSYECICLPGFTKADLTVNKTR
jgi:hypothetical protein